MGVLLLTLDRDPRAVGTTAVPAAAGISALKGKAMNRDEMKAAFAEVMTALKTRYAASPLAVYYIGVTAQLLAGSIDAGGLDGLIVPESGKQTPA